MKDLLLFPIMICVIIFGFFVMRKVDRFISDNQQYIAEENRNAGRHIRIAAESPVLLECVSSAFENYSEIDPNINFFLSSGKAAQILEKLNNERIDIVLLNEESDIINNGNYSFLLISVNKDSFPVTSIGLNAENLEGNKKIRVVWNKKYKSKDRDRIIFTIENEFCQQLH